MSALCTTPSQSALLLTHITQHVERQHWSTIFAEAAKIRRQLHGSTIAQTLQSQTIAYTNVCSVGCSFCAFYRSPTSRSAYVMTVEETVREATQAVQNGAQRIVLQGGVNPDISLHYYEDLIAAVAHALPAIQFDGFSPREILTIAQKNNLSLVNVLTRFHAAGLGGLAGSGNEMLASPSMASPHTAWYAWQQVMQTAQQIGFRTSATLVWGFGETWQQRLHRLNELHDLHMASLIRGEAGFSFLLLWPVIQSGISVSHDEIAQMFAAARCLLPSLSHIAAPYASDSALAQVALSAGADLLMYE